MRVLGRQTRKNVSLSGVWIAGETVRQIQTTMFGVGDIPVRRASDALRNGATRSDLRRVGWEHPEHGIVRPVGDDLDPLRSRLEIACARMTEHCVIGGWAALRLQGNIWFDGQRDETFRPILVHCEPGSRLRSRPSIQPFRGLLHRDEWSTYEGLSTTTFARAVFDEMRMARTTTEAVIALDMAVSTTHGSPHTSLAAVDQVLASHHKVRGIVQAHRARALASARSTSPLETWVRVIAGRDAGLGKLKVNIPIFDLSERLLGVADLYDDATGMVVEVDGAQHRDPESHADDNEREERFERAGLTVVRVSAIDLQRDRWSLVNRLTSAHRDAATSTRRLWTTATPEWWHSWPQAQRWL